MAIFEDMKIRLAIVEDQPAIRRTLSTYLNAQPEFECVLVAESMEELIGALEAGVPPPRLVLSDIGLGDGLSGIDGIDLIRQLSPQTEVVLITVYQDADRTFKALCAGAAGYLVKTTPLPQIKQSLLDVLAGGAPMSPAIARHILRYFRPATAPSATVLTAQEQELMAALEQGLSYQLVADRLGISIEAVCAYVRSVYEKLQLNTRAERLNRNRLV